MKEFNSILKNLKLIIQPKNFSKEHLEITRLRIENYLNPIQNLNVYFSSYDKGVLSLSVSNLQRIPVIVKGLKLSDGTEILLKQNKLIEGRKPFLPSENIDVKFSCDFKSDCKKINIEKQKLVLQIIGQEQDNYAAISPFYK